MYPALIFQMTVTQIYTIQVLIHYVNVSNVIFVSFMRALSKQKVLHVKEKKMSIWLVSKIAYVRDAVIKHLKLFRNLCQWRGVFVMIKAMDCWIIVSEFELTSRRYVHFLTNTLGEGVNLLIPPTRVQIVPLLFF